MPFGVIAGRSSPSALRRRCRSWPPLLADRFGLLRTMVFTHLPSNVLLVAVAFAPNLATAIVLLLARTALSQMDVPTRRPT